MPLVSNSPTFSSCCHFVPEPLAISGSSYFAFSNPSTESCHLKCGSHTTWLASVFLLLKSLSYFCSVCTLVTTRNLGCEKLILESLIFEPYWSRSSLGLASLAISLSLSRELLLTIKLLLISEFRRGDCSESCRSLKLL